jgi:hypothetical protein
MLRFVELISKAYFICKEPGEYSWLATGSTPEGSEFKSWWGQDFSPLRVIQTGSGAYLAPYPVGTRGSFPGGKVARVRSWPLTSN